MCMHVMARAERPGEHFDKAGGGGRVPAGLACKGATQPAEPRSRAGRSLHKSLRITHRVTGMHARNAERSVGPTAALPPLGEVIIQLACAIGSQWRRNRDKCSCRLDRAPVWKWRAGPAPASDADSSDDKPGARYVTRLAPCDHDWHATANMLNPATQGPWHGVGCTGCAPCTPAFGPSSGLCR